MSFKSSLNPYPNPPPPRKYLPYHAPAWREAIGEDWEYEEKEEREEREERENREKRQHQEKVWVREEREEQAIAAIPLVAFPRPSPRPPSVGLE